MVEALPSVNASLNTLAALLLTAGLVAARRGRFEVHRKLMLTAFGVSVLFLVSYLTYHVSIDGPRRFPGTGHARTLYFTILGTHTILAATVPFLAVATLWRGLRRDDARHRALARWTWPIWMYVSVTGVIIYVMLYRMTWA